MFSFIDWHNLPPRMIWSNIQLLAGLFFYVLQCIHLLREHNDRFLARQTVFTFHGNIICVPFLRQSINLILGILSALAFKILHGMADNYYYQDIYIMWNRIGHMFSQSAAFLTCVLCKLYASNHCFIWFWWHGIALFQEKTEMNVHFWKKVKNIIKGLTRKFYIIAATSTIVMNSFKQRF